MLAWRTCYERAGAFDSSLFGAQDWDMVVRLTRQGDLRFLNEVILYYRRHSENGSNDLKQNIRETRIMLHRIFNDSANSIAQREIVRVGWRAWQIHKLNEKSPMVFQNIAKWKLVPALSFAGQLIIHSIRWLRGYPTRTGI
jgi:hypothetical protein